MQVDLLINDGKNWLRPRVLSGLRLQRAANAAAVLDCVGVKNGMLTFLEGAPVRLRLDGQTVFVGRVFSKRRRQPELIQVRAYDQLRYLQNRDCCMLRDFTPGDLLRRICSENNMQLGKVADCGLRLGAHSFDNRRYLDMLAEVLAEVWQARGRRYFVYDDCGAVCLQSCWDMRVNILLAADCIGGYEYATSIDEKTYNRVKVIYEDKRKGLRKEFVAEDGGKIADWGVLQLVSKNADAKQQTYSRARELLQLYRQRRESLLVLQAPGNIMVRGGSMVGVRLNLGEQLVDCWALVKRAEHLIEQGNCLMNLSLELQ